MKGIDSVLCSFVPFLGPQHNLNLYLLFGGGVIGESILLFSPHVSLARSRPAAISHGAPPELSEFNRITQTGS